MPWIRLLSDGIFGHCLDHQTRFPGRRRDGNRYARMTTHGGCRELRQILDDMSASCQKHWHDIDFGCAAIDQIVDGFVQRWSHHFKKSERHQLLRRTRHDYSANRVEGFWPFRIARTVAEQNNAFQATCPIWHVAEEDCVA